MSFAQTSCLALFPAVTQLGVRQSSRVMFINETFKLFSDTSYIQSEHRIQGISLRFARKKVRRPASKLTNCSESLVSDF